MSHDLVCSKNVLVLAWHNDATKEWGALVTWALNQLCISYEPKITSRTIQGERIGAGARIITGVQCAMGEAMVND